MLFTICNINSSIKLHISPCIKKSTQKENFPIPRNYNLNLSLDHFKHQKQMKENQFTYLQLVYSRVIHYPSLPISESPQRKFENSSIPIKKSTQKIQILIIHQNPKKIRKFVINSNRSRS